MDEHIPRSITDELRRRGIDVLTVQEDNRQGIPDSDVLKRAIEIQRVIFSQDQDFLALANLRRQPHSCLGSATLIFPHDTF
jgi:predicted nuclease of predicted toxin-antitoxin system